jgi:hypothetical protein
MSDANRLDIENIKWKFVGFYAIDSDLQTVKLHEGDALLNLSSG